jgi:D-alanine-D-alanine ligase-like ATP-grasp enzyme
VKPREEYGSLHLYIVRSDDELQFDLKAIQKYGWHPIIQEYLNDSYLEFTSGVTIDQSGNP